MKNENPNCSPKFDVLEDVDEILSKCLCYESADTSLLSHPMVQRFGIPNGLIYVDDSTVEINGITYARPLLIPMVDEHLEIIQCAVAQDQQLIQVIPGGYAKGFAYHGEMVKDKPIILTDSIEVFYRLTHTTYSVVLVITPNMCKNDNTKRNNRNVKQIERAVNQLTSAGYSKIYFPIRPEHKAYFDILEKNTELNLLTQYQEDIQCELSQYDDVEDIEYFLDNAIKRLNQEASLSEGHLARPMKWNDGCFQVLTSGIYYVESNSEGKIHKRFISSPVLVKAKTRDHTSNNWGILLEWQDDNNVCHRQALSMELFQTDGADLRKELAYQGVTISTERRARNLFLDYLANYPTDSRALCVDSVGWHGDIFVLPHCNFGETYSEPIVYQAKNSIDNRYQSKGTLAQWRSEVSQKIQEHSLLVFAVSTAFTGQLLTPLNQQGGGFHIKGGSSKGKTTALNLASSVWGDPTKFYRTWRATGNALEITALMHNDGFLVLDEIGEVTNPKELGLIVYMLANGVGKARMTKHITSRPQNKWKVVFLSSGEKSLKQMMEEQGQKTKLGQEIRLADIDIDDSEFGIFDCINFAESAAQQATKINNNLNSNYGVAGHQWLEYLTTDKDVILSTAKKLLNEYRELLLATNAKGHITRVANSFALVAVAGELATKAGITGWPQGTAIKSICKVFRQWREAFEQSHNSEEREILAHVKAFFEANGASRFESITPDPSNSFRVFERLGYWKIVQGEKYYMVYPEQFRLLICKGFNPKKVISVLKAYGWLELSNSNESSRTERIPDTKKTTRMYVFNEKIWEFY